MNVTDNAKINLKGLAVGNGLTDPGIQYGERASLVQHSISLCKSDADDLTNFRLRAVIHSAGPNIVPQAVQAAQHCARGLCPFPSLSGSVFGCDGHIVCFQECKEQAEKGVWID